MMSAFFALPQLSRDRVVLGGVSFDPNYLKQTFFPEMLEELIARKMTEDGENPLAMVVYPTDHEGGHGNKVLAASAGWGEGKPEVSRNLDDVFRGLALGIKFQGTSVEALGRALGSAQFSHPRRSVAADDRWSGADLSQRQQRNGAGPPEV